MQYPDVDRLSVRDLKFLIKVVEGASITRAGDAFDLSQPAASRLMEKLRTALSDPILVRSRSGWTPTSTAVEIQKRISPSLRELESSVASHLVEPEHSQRQFNLATTDYGALVVLGPLVSRLAKSAPSIRFEVEAFSLDTFNRLESGIVDFAFYADDVLPGDFHYRDLFRDQYAFVMDKRHPLAEHPKLSAQTVSRFPRAVVLYPFLEIVKEDDPIKSLSSVTSPAVVRTPFFTAAASLASGTDIVICMPCRAADVATSSSSRLVQVALDAELAFSYRLIWHDRIHRDPTFTWLRRQLFEIPGHSIY